MVIPTLYIRKVSYMSSAKTLTDAQILEIGRKTVARQEGQKQYDALYNARTKWVYRQLVKLCNDKGQGITALKEQANSMTIDELTA